MKQKSFVLYADALEIWEKLTDEQAGKLILALLRLVNNGEEPSFDDLQLDMMYSFVSHQIKRDLEKYERVCEMRRMVAKKGGAPKGNQNARKNNQNNQLQAKQPDNDNDTVNDNDTDNDNVNVTVNKNDTVNVKTNKTTICKQNNLILIL